MSKCDVVGNHIPRLISLTDATSHNNNVKVMAYAISSVITGTGLTGDERRKVKTNQESQIGRNLRLTCKLCYTMSHNLFCQLSRE